MLIYALPTNHIQAPILFVVAFYLVDDCIAPQMNKYPSRAPRLVCALNREDLPRRKLK